MPLADKLEDGGTYGDSVAADGQSLSPTVSPAAATSGTIHYDLGPPTYEKTGWGISIAWQNANGFANFISAHPERGITPVNPRIFDDPTLDSTWDTGITYYEDAAPNLQLPALHSDDWVVDILTILNPQFTSPDYARLITGRQAFAGGAAMTHTSKFQLRSGTWLIICQAGDTSFFTNGMTPLPNDFLATLSATGPAGSITLATCDKGGWSPAGATIEDPATQPQYRNNAYLLVTIPRQPAGLYVTLTINELGYGYPRLVPGTDQPVYNQGIAVSAEWQHF